ncbi:mitotic-spindle organizing protein 2B isoform X1 [Notamacropus eugenii]|uniref:mitotic-spindle organizing protein 2B isoform X1 n=1 Tax=Notamacropus eugenii TaxID=9315 RepID=UPI003B67F6A9
MAAAAAAGGAGAAGLGAGPGGGPGAGGSGPGPPGLEAALQKLALRRKKVLNAEETELYELALAAGGAIDPDVFKILVDLLKLNVAPLAVFQMLKSMCAGQRLAMDPAGPENMGSTLPPSTLPDTRGLPGSLLMTALPQQMAYVKMSALKCARWGCCQGTQGETRAVVQPCWGSVVAEKDQASGCPGSPVPAGCPRGAVLARAPLGTVTEGA